MYFIGILCIDQQNVVRSGEVASEKIHGFLVFRKNLCGMLL